MMSLPTIPRQFSWLIPVMAGGVLVLLSAALPNRYTLDDSAVAHKANVATAVEEVPWFIGAWVGENWKVPQEAQELLRPNAILSRSYSRPGGPKVHVLLVHCGDSRDMQGHFPPVCYPSNGWVAVRPDGPDQATLRVEDRELPVREYGFRLMHEQGMEERIRIFNAFVLPDGMVTRNIDDINRQSERLAVSALGVAQLQVITDSRLSREEALEAAGEVLSGMSGLWEALSVASGVDHGP